MLKLDHVSKFYSSNGVITSGFSKVSLELHSGEFAAITGESGSGKSTLLNVISGLDSYEEGEMYIFGRPTSGYTGDEMERYRKKYIANIFQTFNLINNYTVYQNVELVLLLNGYKRKEVKERVNDIIRKVGLWDYRRTKASKLSGGQKQRVAIARALARETPIIVADEPTGNLDVASAAEIIKLLASLSQDKLILIVTHNYEQVEPYVTRRITMHDGRIIEDKKLTPQLAVGTEAPKAETIAQAAAPAEEKPAEDKTKETAPAAEAAPAASGESFFDDDEDLEAELAALQESQDAQDAQDAAAAMEDEAPEAAAPVQDAPEQPAGEAAWQTPPRSRSGRLSAGNTVRLGLRNAFSLPAKFLLVLFVFLFLCAGTFLSYGGAMNIRSGQTELAVSGIFADSDPRRLVIKKADGSAFTQDDYDIIADTPNVASIQKHDILLDATFQLSNLSREELYGEEAPEDPIYETVYLQSLDGLEDRLVAGRMPEKPREAILMMPDDEYSRDFAESVLDKDLYFSNEANMPAAENMDIRIRITGYAIETQEESDALLHSQLYYDARLCIGDALLDEILETTFGSRYALTARTGDNTITLVPVGASETSEYSLVADEKVEPGTVCIPELLSYNYQNAAASGKSFGIEAAGRYETKEFDYKVAGVYTENNYRQLLSTEKKYGEITQGIYMNPEDITAIYQEDIYQSSVFVQDTTTIDKTQEALEGLGLTVLNVNKAASATSAMLLLLERAFLFTVLAALLIGLYFISYFIIKLIYKSRNVYFSTVRMLGGNRRNCTFLQLTDMLAVFHIAFAAVLVLLFLVRKGVIRPGDYLQKAAGFITPKSCILLYVVVLVMTIFLALRYARQMFRMTSMNAYKEEV